MSLGARLRELRTSAFGRPVRQTDLAEALKIGNSTVSTWEGDIKPPRDERLLEIATFFSTPRSLSPLRLLDEGELSAAERARRDAIYRELRSLTEAGGEPRNPWHFPDGAPVRIICGGLSRENRSRYASGLDHNYMAMAGYADQDSLMELFGHIRAANPGSDVQFKLAHRLESHDLRGHLALLGNIGWIQGGAFNRLALPVTPVEQDHLDGEVFLAQDGERFEPTLADPDDPSSPVVEDVGLFWRAPSPFNSAHTLTICSGVFTRGVYGAVRMLTDSLLRDVNSRFVQDRLRAADGRYGVLVRVPVHDHATSTPDLTDEKSRRREFPPQHP